MMQKNQDAIPATKIKLNSYQEEAVEHFNGPCFVCAIPGSGKCITGNSIVVLNDGFSEISNDKVEWVRAFDSESLNRSKYQSIRITNFVDSGIKPTLYIGTEEGYNIQGTYHHPIAILNNKCELEWKKLEDIQVGDITVLQMEKTYDNPITRHPGAYDIWYAIGLLLGDGYLSRNNEISITTNDDQIEYSFTNIFKHYFNYEVKKYYDKRRVGLRTLGVFSKDIKTNLRQKFGNIYHLACNKELSPEILAGNRGELGSLLQGLFDTDGYVSGANVEICLCSRKLIEQIQIIMLRFGVFSSYSTKEVDGSIYYRLHISGEDMRRFENNIGFRLTRKKEQLRSIACKKSNPNRTIPYAQYLVTKIYNEVKAKRPDNYDPKTSHFYDTAGGFVRLIRYCSKSKAVLRGLTETAAYRLISACELAGIESEALEQLKFLVDNFGFSKVAEVVDGGEQHVYDYFIEGSHNFIANGFVNHNTRIITERVISLINKEVDPKSILCITFTNKASKEMKERVVQRLGQKGEMVYISTFHAMCLTILRKYGSYLGYDTSVVILDDSDQESLMAQCARQNGYEIDKPKIKEILWKLNELRENLIPEQDFAGSFPSEMHSSIALSYLQKMRLNKQIDFSGILSETIKLLEVDSETRCKLHSRFQYIQVDETQDTNLAQFKFIEMIGCHGNVFIVGDSDQTVYSWRGARYKNIQDFVEKYKAKVIPLPQNYRSTPQIVKVAANLIKHNPNRTQQFEFQTENPNGAEVRCLRSSSPEKEALWIASEIKNMINYGKYDAHDFAILYRTNAMSMILEQAMMQVGVGYEVIGGFSFFDRSEIKDCLAMLRFLINNKDGTALAKFINKPSNGIGEITVGKIENFASSKNITLIESLLRTEEYITGQKKDIIINRCKEIGKVFERVKLTCKNEYIGKVLYDLVEGLSYYDHLEKFYEGKEVIDRKENVKELITGAEMFARERKNDISEYLSNLALQTSTDKSIEQNRVSLMTIHASKGLEFPVVFMPFMEDGLFPHKRSVEEKNGTEGLEEERRLCYVGITRAKKELFVSFSAQRMTKDKKGIKYSPIVPSRFIKEAGLHNKIESTGV